MIKLNQQRAHQYFKCLTHNKYIDFCCIEASCIESDQFALCQVCFENHPNNHKPHSIPRISSYELADDIQNLRNKHITEYQLYKDQIKIIFKNMAKEFTENLEECEAKVLSQLETIISTQEDELSGLQENFSSSYDKYDKVFSEMKEYAINYSKIYRKFQEINITCSKVKSTHIDQFEEVITNRKRELIIQIQNFFDEFNIILKNDETKLNFNERILNTNQIADSPDKSNKIKNNVDYFSFLDDKPYNKSNEKANSQYFSQQPKQNQNKFIVIKKSPEAFSAETKINEDIQKYFGMAVKSYKQKYDFIKISQEKFYQEEKDQNFYLKYDTFSLYLTSIRFTEKIIKYYLLDASFSENKQNHDLKKLKSLPHLIPKLQNQIKELGVEYSLSFVIAENDELSLTQAFEAYLSERILLEHYCFMLKVSLESNWEDFAGALSSLMRVNLLLIKIIFPSSLKKRIKVKY